MVKAGFGMRRKTLINALKGVAEGEAVRAALSALGLPETVRGEALAVETWIALAQRVRPGIRYAIHAGPPIESAACRRQTA